MAWRIDGNHSGLAVLSGDAQRIRLTAVSDAVTSMAAVVEFCRRHLSPDTVIAIDASLVVNNVAGLRPCERLIARTFGRYQASCHPSNLGRPHARSGERLVEKLGELGVRHDFQLDSARQRPGRWLFEVYPHPAMVRIFGLDRIIKYKKGSPDERRRGLAELESAAACAHLRIFRLDRVGAIGRVVGARPREAQGRVPEAPRGHAGCRLLRLPCLALLALGCRTQ